MLELAKNFEQIWNPLRFDAFSLVLNDSFKDHLIWQIFARIFKLRGYTDGTFSPVILDSILYDIEDDQLV
jgi:hypothetical protein